MAFQTADNPEAGRARNIAALVSGALIAFGIICWIAANWASLHRLTKIGLVGSTLFVAALVAAVAPRIRIPALIVATATTGGLLALIGQIYPSGADAWQLFFYWMLLSLPFALAARHDAIWSLWTIIAITAIQLWNVQEGRLDSEAFGDWAPAWALSIFLAIVLTPTTWTERLLGPTRWAFRIAVIAAAGLVLTTAIIGSFGNQDSMVLAALALLALAVLALIWLRPRDLGLVALVLLAFDILLIWRVAELIAPTSTGIDSLFLISLLAIGVIGASVVILRRIAPVTSDEPSESAEPQAQRAEDSHTTWPLAVLSGVGAIIASIPLVALYALVFENFIAGDGAIVIGLATLAVAVLVMRRSATLGFVQMFGAICVAAGLALITIGAERLARQNVGFVLAVVMAATAMLIPVAWARGVLGFTAASAFLISTLVRTMPGHATALSVILSLTAAIAAVGLTTRKIDRTKARGDFTRDAQPFIAGFADACVVALMLFAGRPFMILAAGFLGELRSEFLAPAIGVAQTFSIILALAGATLFFCRHPTYRTPAAFALAAVAIALTTRSPMLGPTLFVLACAFVIGARGVAAFASLAMLWIVSAAYYALGWSLTQKAWSMIGLGLLLAVVLLVTARNFRMPASALGVTISSLQPRLLIAASIIATGVLAGLAVTSAENILRTGREIFIALRPVDPRSLMQGDYMAVAFDTARLPSPADARNREVLAVATLDDKSIASFQRIAATGEPRNDGEVAIWLRTKSRRWFVGSDAFFFEEGKAKTFEAAKFGMFRLSANGQPLLVGLADAELHQLR